MTLTAVSLTLSFVASCTKVEHGSPGSMLAYCGVTFQPEFGIGSQTYLDLTVANPPQVVDVYANAAGAFETTIRVSGNCNIGATVSAVPAAAAHISTVVPAKNGKPETVRVSLQPTATSVTMTIDNESGSLRTLVLRNAGSPSATAS